MYTEDYTTINGTARQIYILGDQTPMDHLLSLPLGVDLEEQEEARRAAGREVVRRILRQRRKLASVGVELANQYAKVNGDTTLRCTTCAETWQPTMQPYGKLRRYFWMCPNHCNNPNPTLVQRFLRHQDLLASIGLALADPNAGDHCNPLLRCTTCRRSWWPTTSPTGRPWRYRLACPNGCNQPGKGDNHG